MSVLHEDTAAICPATTYSQIGHHQVGEVHVPYYAGYDFRKYLVFCCVYVCRFYQGGVYQQTISMALPTLVIRTLPKVPISI